MSTHNIPFQYQIKGFLGTQEGVRTAVVNEPSVFEPLKFYCISILCKVNFLLPEKKVTLTY